MLGVSHRCRAGNNSLPCTALVCDGSRRAGRSQFKAAASLPCEAQLKGVEAVRSSLPGARSRSVLHTIVRSASGDAAGESTVEAVAGADRYEIVLRKPLGIVFGEKGKGGAVYVEELVEGGNAEKSGVVRIGDVLKECSATVLKAGKEGEYEREGYGQRPFDNWETVRFACEGQDFDTVMNAIRSNNERWGIFTVTLVLQRAS